MDRVAPESWLPCQFPHLLKTDLNATNGGCTLTIIKDDDNWSNTYENQKKKAKKATVAISHIKDGTVFIFFFKARSAFKFTCIGSFCIGIPEANQFLSVLTDQLGPVK